MVHGGFWRVLSFVRVPNLISYHSLQLFVCVVLYVCLRRWSSCPACMAKACLVIVGEGNVLMWEFVFAT
jgi:hypothetical protein